MSVIFTQKKNFENFKPEAHNNKEPIVAEAFKIIATEQIRKIMLTSSSYKSNYSTYLLGILGASISTISHRK